MAAPKGNTYAEGCESSGRPALFDSEAELVAEIESYFEHIKGEKKKTKAGKRSRLWERKPENPTVTGLALYLGFESRQSFYDYENKQEFSYTIKKCRLRIEAFYEQNLLSYNTTGAIFALKNFGWRDKIEAGFTDKQGNDLQTEKPYSRDQLIDIIKQANGVTPSD